MHVTIHWLVAAVCLAGAAPVSGQGTITFDGSVVHGTNYYERGVWFHVVNGGGVAIQAGGGNHSPFYMTFYQGSGSGYVVLSLTNGLAFGLASVDLADAYCPSTASVWIMFIGRKADGPSVTNTFTTPGNGAVALETYRFATEFLSGLTNVEIHATSWAMDNLVVVTRSPPPPLVAPASPQFSAPITSYVGGAPGAMVAADFNQDGTTDVAFIGGSWSPSVCFGRAEGSFSNATNYPPAGGGTVLAPGDFNNDGNADLVMVSDYSWSVLLGNGAGGFTRTNVSTYLGSVTAVAVGDFNGDGNLDLAIAVDKKVMLAFGRGDGSFALATNYYSLSISALGLAAGDLNGDGSLDLVAVGAGTQGTCVLINQGDGTFAAPRYYTSSADYTRTLVLGDFDGDGNVDMAVVNSTGNSVTIRLNNGEWFWSLRDYPLGFAPNGIVAGDFNGDGNVDLLVRGGANATFLLGRGDGTFAFGPSLTLAADTGKQGTVTVADFNHDGQLDILFTSSAAGTVGVLLNQTQPTLSIVPMPGVTQISWPALISAGYLLEWTTNLATAGSWQPFPVPPFSIGNQKTVADWTGGGGKFYRLRRP